MTDPPPHLRAVSGARPPDHSALSRDGIALWRGLFGNCQPVSVEVGPGRGEFLLTMAERSPDENFFAIERSQPRAEAIVRMLEARGLGNARAIHGDAACVIAQVLPASCISRYFIHFPDPWWKRRHHRRRLMTPAFVAAMRRTLVPGGTIQLATDVAEYFHLARRCLDADAELEPSPTPAQMAVATAFGRKASARRAVIHLGVYRRIERGPGPAPPTRDVGTR